MLKTFLFLFFVIVFSITNAQNTLSTQAEISVITIGPGTSLNDAFGHNAFRIKDPIYNYDKTFDYGRFDFDAPNFYLNFCRGKLNYSLGSADFNRFLYTYKYQNRSVKEQVLNLTQDEKQKVFNFLINNYKPENRNYLYEFFFDNCATKIRDVLQIALDNKIIFETPDSFKNKKFRRLIHDNVYRNSWGCFGIDIALGSIIDREATASEHMFLPKYIYTFFNKATLLNTNEKLVKQTHVLNEQKGTLTSFNFFTSPLFVLGLFSLFIISITYSDFKKQKPSIWLDIILFIITGLVGIVVLLLWFATDHSGTHNNYNLLWAFAANIFMIRQLLKKKTNLWFIKYLKFLVILLCLLTLHWLVGVQIYAIGLIPLIIALFIRYIFLIKHLSGASKRIQ